jgi:hypothetical protein
LTEGSQQPPDVTLTNEGDREGDDQIVEGMAMEEGT